MIGHALKSVWFKVFSVQCSVYGSPCSQTASATANGVPSREGPFKRLLDTIFMPILGQPCMTEITKLLLVVSLPAMLCIALQAGWFIGHAPPNTER